MHVGTGLRVPGQGPGPHEACKHFVGWPARPILLPQLVKPCGHLLFVFLVMELVTLLW